MFKKTFVILMLIVVIFGLLFLNLRKDEKTEILAQAASYSAPCTGACGIKQCQGDCFSEADCLITACSGAPDPCPARPNSADDGNDCWCQGDDPTCACIWSVVEGSKVLMADGTHKNIEAIRAEDYIKSFNTETQEFTNSQVKSTSQHQEEGYLIINNSLKVTESHYIYLDKIFQEAKNAKPGSLLLNEKGQEVEIFSIEFVPEKVFTYHLSVDCQNNFFAGGYLVHNQGVGMCLGEHNCSISGTCNYICDAGWVNCNGQVADGCECNTGAGYTCAGGICDPPACVPCPQHSHYECVGGCGGTVKDIWHEPCCGGGTWTKSETSCAGHEMCNATTGSCACSGQCLAAPTNPKYYNDPIANTEVAGIIKLPVKFGWNDVAGAQSYVITINNARPVDPYSGVTTVSEFIPPSCTLKSEQNHQWEVKACCDIGGTNCQEDPAKQLVATITTNEAPEPVSPYDPDWAGLDEATPYWDESEDYPIEFSWCEIDSANSYLIRAWKDSAEYCPIMYCPIIIFGPTTTISFDVDSFTKGTRFDWNIAACSNDDGTGCGTSSQMWSFTGTTTLAKVKLSSPANDGCVNFHSRLEWLHTVGARSYRYNVTDKTTGIQVIDNIPVDDVFVLIEDIWDNLALNSTYTWEVMPCWDDVGNKCEESSWSDEWQFTTAGATPTNLKVAARHSITNRALIPLQLDWDDMPCAASYKYEVTDELGNIIAEGLTSHSNFSVDYDPALGHPQQDALYSWQVETCADGESNICGSPASSDLTTFILDPPENPYPADGESFYTNESYLKWNRVEGASFYRYEVVGKIGPTIVPAAQNYIHILNVATWDLIDYTWWAQACIDENCNEEGASSTWTFTLVEGEAPSGIGLVPCGRYADNPDTLWNETDPCGIEHIFIMIYSIIRYLLWKLIPIVLVLLTIASAIIFYFSGQLGIPEPTAQVKSLWKAAGIGLVVIFLAWIITSVILGLLGYKVGIFGTWWILDF